MTIALENRSGRMKVFNLTHAIAPVRREFDRLVGGEVTGSRAKGELKTERRRVVVPDSITFPVGGKLEGLDARVAHVPAVARAIQRGELVLTEETPAATEPAPKKSAARSTRTDG